MQREPGVWTNPIPDEWSAEMLSRFFLDRPVFAWVIAIILMDAGALAIFGLPISQ